MKQNKSILKLIYLRLKLQHMYTHTHTYTQAHIYTYTHTYIHAPKYIHIYICIQI